MIGASAADVVESAPAPSPSQEVSEIDVSPVEPEAVVAVTTPPVSQAEATQKPVPPVGFTASAALGFTTMQFRQQNGAIQGGFNDSFFNSWDGNASIGIRLHTIGLEAWLDVNEGRRFAKVVPIGVQIDWFLSPIDAEVFGGIGYNQFSLRIHPGEHFTGGDTKLGIAWTPLHLRDMTHFGFRAEGHLLAFRTDGLGIIPDRVATNAWIAMFGLTFRWGLLPRWE